MKSNLVLNVSDSNSNWVQREVWFFFECRLKKGGEFDDSQSW